MSVSTLTGSGASAGTGTPGFVPLSPRFYVTGLDMGAIAALKGKSSAAAKPVANEEPAGPGLPPLVSPRHVHDIDLYPVSASIPVSEVHAELSRLKAEYAAMEEALAMANGTIDTIHGQLGQANARIVTLLTERTNGVERIIASLRDFEAEAAKTGPIGPQADTLREIFSQTTHLTKRSNEALFNDKIETTLKTALSAFQGASGGAFTYTLQSFERPDFWTRQNSRGSADPDYPAKMMLLEMGRTDDPAGNSKNGKYIIICVGQNIFHMPYSEFKTKSDKGRMFMNDTGMSSPAIFYYQSGRLYYDYDNSMNGPYQFDNGINGVAPFIDAFMAKAMPQVLNSGEFNRAFGSFRAMGLTP